MRDVLIEHNRRLRLSLDELTDQLQAARIPAELEAYRTLIVGACMDLRRQAEQHLSDLAGGVDEILEDILSATQYLTQMCSLVSVRFALPVLRASDSDRLALRIIGWMHEVHPQTQGLPPAFADGPTAVYPNLGQIPIYMLPCMDRRGLLYLPLLFHELGHVLYARHRREMDDLVGALQRAIARHLEPASRRNDRHAEEQARQRQRIVNAWYSWVQEFFCDAVGLLIGGPAFLQAFAAYLSMLAPGDFGLAPEDLQQSTHPITWLRIQALVERARGLGYHAAADAVERQWRTVAGAVGAREDYHGFYDSTIGAELRRTVDDMLVEADPRACTADEAAAGDWCAATDTPIRLLNWAWQTYLDNPDDYRDWEHGIVQGWLTPTHPPQGDVMPSADDSKQRATATPSRIRSAHRRRRLETVREGGASSALDPSSDRSTPGRLFRTTA